MAAIDPIAAAPRRLSICLPRPLWIGVAASVLVVVAVGLRIGIPIYWHERATRAIERCGGSADDFYEETGPLWLRDWVGDRWMQALYGPSSVCGGENFSDTEMPFLASLENMKILFLLESKVTNAGLTNIKACVSLTNLSLDATEISDAGLAHLNRLTHLQELSISGTQVTNSGLAHLRGMTQLRGLWLDHTRATDAGLQQLRELTNLEVLVLANTSVTDAGIVHLKGLTRLELLKVTDTEVTEAGIADLKRALPGLRVDW